MFVEYQKYLREKNLNTYEEQLINCSSKWKSDSNFIAPITLDPVMYDKLTLTKDECNELIILGNCNDFSIRRSLKAGSLDSTPGKTLEPIQKAKKIILDMNRKTYNYSIDEDYFELVLHKWQFGLGYSWHVDMNHYRPYCKYTASIQLSDPQYYKGGDLIFFTDGMSHMEEGHVMLNTQGTINIFPSFVPHRVSKLESGYRYSLLFFFYGDPFR